MRTGLVGVCADGREFGWGGAGSGTVCGAGNVAVTEFGVLLAAARRWPA